MTLIARRDAARPTPAARPLHPLARLVLPLLAATALAACQDRSPDVAAEAAPSPAAATRSTQVVARVNGEELTVHQLNDRANALAPDTALDESQRAQVLERLIELTLARQAAETQGLQQDPAVLRQVQAARVDLLARAWAQQVGEEAGPPPPEDIRRHYDEHPDAYARRRIYQAQELQAQVPTAQQEALLRQLSEHRQPQGFGRVLDAAGHRWSLSLVERGSEQLDATTAEQARNRSREQPLVVPGGTGLRVWWIVGASDQGLSWERAQPLIERQLTQQRRAERVRRELQDLRSRAQVEWMLDAPDPRKP